MPVQCSLYDRYILNGKKGSYHNGYDIAADSGTPVYAPSSGKVMLTGNYYFNGKFIMINHLKMPSMIIRIM